jgi:transposase
MKATPVAARIATIAVDLAKQVFQLACADAEFRVVRSLRLKRADFIAFWANLPLVHVVMEACGSAHHFGRWLESLGHRVTLLPPQYVRPYVRRNKTDAADCQALLEALRARDIAPVPIKSERQQIIQLMHRTRQQWQRDRTARINLARGMLREFGVEVPEGANAGIACMLEQRDNDAIDLGLRALLGEVLSEIATFDAQIDRIDRAIDALAAADPVIAKLDTLPGLGALTASALCASVGDIQRFKTGRAFANWLGFTPRESSSGSTRQLGRITKHGDVYVRTMVIQGARAVLAAAIRKHNAHHPLDTLRTWAVDLADRRGFNKAAVGLANKLARIAWATWKHDREFDADYALAKHPQRA